MLVYHRVLIYSMVHPRTSSHKISFDQAELRVKGQMQLVLLNATKKKEEANGRSIEQRLGFWGSTGQFCFFFWLMFCDSFLFSLVFFDLGFFGSVFFSAPFFGLFAFPSFSFRIFFAGISSVPNGIGRPHSQTHPHWIKLGLTYHPQHEMVALPPKLYKVGPPQL